MDRKVCSRYVPRGGYGTLAFGTAGAGGLHGMRVLVKHPDKDDDGRLKAHAEKLLRRVFDRHCLAVDRVQVMLRTLAGAEGGRASRCRVTIKLILGGSVTAEASDREAVLALYRAVDKAVFLLWQCLKTANGRCGTKVSD